jgi:hypothetical protein
MVESARASLGPYLGLAHEFVLVDGGSRDGTQAWCVSQPDVRLIEHGKLLGAVKAFNDGAAAAKGNYVILANDDVEFHPDSIWLAWRHMQSHPDCGLGCFYQDREGKAWYVDVMPVVIGGKQSTAYYGQVCIVPKWMGDMVGWWGDYLHTYGGDNEISSRVYELGYAITPVEGARIHDASPDDDLRRINNITGGQDPKAVRGHHPDSWAWGRAWRSRPEHLQYENGRNLVGAVVRTMPTVEREVPMKEMVLYLPIYEQGWEGVQHEQKRGLREALAEVAIVCEYDYVGEAARRGQPGMLHELNHLARQSFPPTLIVSQLHNGSLVSADDIRSLRDHLPGVVWVNWNGDFWPENLLSPDGIALATAIDWQLTVNRSALERYRELGINAAYWQIGWEPDGVGQPPGEAHDVVFLASGYSPARQGLVRQIRTWGFDFALHGSGWPEGWSRGSCLYDFRTGCGIYQAAKISIGDSQWPDTGFVSNRVFQALAAGGAMLAHQWFRGMEELGLVDGETCAVWKNAGELREKVDFYLQHPNERRQVAAAGEALALEKHSFTARVRELWGLLGKEAGAAEVGSEWRW